MQADDKGAEYRAASDESNEALRKVFAAQAIDQEKGAAGE
jgi:hypothetical protein